MKTTINHIAVLAENHTYMKLCFLFQVSRLETELQGSQEDLRTNEKKLLNLEIDIKRFKSEILSSQENEKKLKENFAKLEKDLQDQKRKV